MVLKIKSRWWWLKFMKNEKLATRIATCIGQEILYYEGERLESFSTKKPLEDSEIQRLEREGISVEIVQPE